MDRYFILSWRPVASMGELDKYHLLAPEPISEEDFIDLCYKLARKTALELLEVYKDTKYPVGWSEILEGVVKLLVNNHGYTEISLKKCEFKVGSHRLTNRFPVGESETILGDILADIVHHNDVTIWESHDQVVS